MGQAGAEMEFVFQPFSLLNDGLMPNGLNRGKSDGIAGPAAVQHGNLANPGTRIQQHRPERRRVDVHAVDREYALGTQAPSDLPEKFLGGALRRNRFAYVSIKDDYVVLCSAPRHVSRRIFDVNVEIRGLTEVEIPIGEFDDRGIYLDGVQHQGRPGGAQHPRDGCATQSEHQGPLSGRCVCQTEECVARVLKSREVRRAEVQHRVPHPGLGP
jgi:hypothetical protein